jgi:NADH:ubiquinone oxidoreductase subunit 2 (subunit N)
LSLIYGLSFGNTNFSVFPTLMAQAKMLGSVAQIFPFVIFTISLILLVCSIAVKLSLAPFHFWAPDVYNGASLPVTTFLATASKVAAFGIFCRIGWNIFSFNQATFMLWNSAFALLAILSMIVGNLTGARQIFRSNGSIKRLLAYSSIAQIGYVLTGAVLGTDWSLGQSLFYLIMYIVTNLALFIGIIKFESILVKRDIKSIHPDNIDALKGLFKIKPKLAIFLALCLANLGGILPFMLIAKFILIDASVHASLSGNALSSVLPFDLVTKLNLDKIPFAVNPWISLLMAATLILTSIVALFYYSTLIKKMFVDEPLPEILDKAKAREENYSFSAGNFVGNLVINFVCVALLIGSISFSIFPNFWASQVSTFSAQSLIVSSSNTLDVIVRK